jgi:hypothetical protein
MVEVAEAYPSVGIVGSYRLDDVWVNCAGLPYPSVIISGSEICRSTLLRKLYVFGSPTTILIRSDLIRNQKAFYNEDNLHADTESCFAILQDNDFGFVHQVLSFTRRENEAITTFARRFNTYTLGDLIILKKYGSIYLNNNEFRQILNGRLRDYHRFLAKVIFKMRKKEIWEYHKKGLRKLGYRISYPRILHILIVTLYNRMLDRLRIKA